MIADAISLLLPIPATILIAMACLPNSWCNTRVKAFRQLVTILVGLQLVVAAFGLLAFATSNTPALHFVPFGLAGALSYSPAIMYDGVACLMFALVSFVSWSICQYSIRYLDGEPTQGRYFRWTGFTIGAVSLMVLSGNLLLLIGSWVVTSLGLHQLLLHYGHRPAARRAAWTKFTISRIGDASLIAATLIIYDQFGTFDFAELFAAAGLLTNVPPAMQVAGFLMIAGAATKSAQFPFHTWLPQTLETPTPVSALMHAGIVNGGGYLIIRTSPLISVTPWALTALAIIGGFTACFAAVVMLTQTSVKKSLAYSTVAQMGFMLLQCGLGAYSAAMLHILAHSLYKAHAFLSSGSVIVERAASTDFSGTTRPVNTANVAVVASVMVAMLGVSFTLLGVEPNAKPGGLLLGGVLCLALTQWVVHAMRLDTPSLSVRALVTAAGLCFAYALTYSVVDKIVAASLPVSGGPEWLWLIVVIVLVGFIGMYSLQWALVVGRTSTTFQKWHIHALNGFYLENIIRRVFEPLAHR